MKKNKMTITGDLASGKSTVAKRLCKDLNLNYLSTGQIHRNIADEMGMNALELNLHAEKNEEIDRRIDSVIINLNHKEEGYIVDSRLAWHFVKNSLKIYLSVNNVVAARRVMADKSRHNEPSYANMENALQKLQARKNSENTRFLEKYNADCADLTNFDLIVDTSVPSIEEVADLVLDIYADWTSGKTFHRHWISPKALFPVKFNPRKDNSSRSFDLEIEGAVDVIRYKDFLYIAGRNDLVAAYLENKLPFIPVNVISEEKPPCDFSLFDQWEKTHGFSYYDYPVAGSVK